MGPDGHNPPPQLNPGDLIYRLNDYDNSVSLGTVIGVHLKSHVGFARWYYRIYWIYNPPGYTQLGLWPGGLIDHIDTWRAL